MMRYFRAFRAALGSHSRREAIRREMLRGDHGAPLAKRIEYEVLGRTDYAYGMYQAALQAKRLGLERVSAIEFGVFNGTGLRNMELVAAAIHRELGVVYELFGFDTGEGLPPPTDHRDLGYVWRAGLFAPRRDLSSYLKRAKMVLGDVAQTVPLYCAEGGHAPLAFMSVDVDYYTSSIHCLRVLDQASSKVLPRVFVFLDDVIGGDEELHSRFAGELAAVEAFNASHEMRKIAPINGLRWKRRFPAAWNDQMHVAHMFDHPLYGTHSGSRWDTETGAGM